MLGHLSFGVADLRRAMAFYDAALAPLGYARVWTIGNAGGLRPARRRRQARAQTAVRVRSFRRGPGFHLALIAPSRAAVDRFHAEAMRAGGRDEGAPGPRPHYGANYYARLRARSGRPQARSRFPVMRVKMRARYRAQDGRRANHRAKSSGASHGFEERGRGRHRRQWRARPAHLPRAGREGANIAVVCAQSRDGARRSRANCASHSVKAAAFACDVTDGPRRSQRLVDEVIGRFGRLDILINDAAYNKAIPFRRPRRADHRGVVQDHGREPHRADASASRRWRR